jgi:transposase
MLTGRYRLSRREAEEATEVFFGADVALGSITALEQATSEALAKPWEEALEAVRSSPVVNADETTWPQRVKAVGEEKARRVKAYLWVGVTPTLSVFRIDRRRNRDAFVRFLGDFKGRLVTDRLSTYMHIPNKRHQVCLAHLERDFKKIASLGGTATVVGDQGVAIIHEVFALWHAFKRGESSRINLRRRLKPVKERLHDLLVDGLQNPDVTTNEFCAELLPRWDCLWVFTYVEGVEPTNNASERDLRPAVLWRKGSFGSQSDAGSRYVERMLTVVKTLRKQKRNVLDFIEQACRAHCSGVPPPSLLPP